MDTALAKDKIEKQLRIDRLNEVRRQERLISNIRCSYFKKTAETHRTIRKNIIEHQNAAKDKRMENLLHKKYHQALLHTGDAHRAATNLTSDIKQNKSLEAKKKKNDEILAKDRSKIAAKVMHEEKALLERTKIIAAEKLIFRNEQSLLDRESAHATHESNLFKLKLRNAQIEAERNVPKAKVQIVHNAEQSSISIQDRMRVPVQARVIRHGLPSHDTSAVQNRALDAKYETTKRNMNLVMQELINKFIVKKRNAAAKKHVEKDETVTKVEKSFEILKSIDVMGNRSSRIKSAESLTRIIESNNSKSKAKYKVPIKVEVNEGVLAKKFESYFPEVLSHSAAKYEVLQDSKREKIMWNNVENEYTHNAVSVHAVDNTPTVNKMSSSANSMSRTKKSPLSQRTQAQGPSPQYTNQIPIWIQPRIDESANSIRLSEADDITNAYDGNQVYTSSDIILRRGEEYCQGDKREDVGIGLSEENIQDNDTTSASSCNESGSEFSPSKTNSSHSSSSGNDTSTLSQKEEHSDDSLRLNPSTYVQYLGDTNNVESNHDIIEKSDCENTNTNRESLDSNNYGKDIHNEDLFVVSPQDITITDSRNESSWSDDKLLNNISPCSSTDSLEQFVSASPRHRYARQTYLGSFTNELNEYADESVLSSPSHDSEKEEFIDFSKTTKNPWLSSDRNSPVDSAGNSLSPISSPRPNQYLNNTLTISTTPPTSDMKKPRTQSSRRHFVNDFSCDSDNINFTADDINTSKALNDSGRVTVRARHDYYGDDDSLDQGGNNVGNNQSSFLSSNENSQFSNYFEDENPGSGNKSKKGILTGKYDGEESDGSNHSDNDSSSDWWTVSAPTSMAKGAIMSKKSSFGTAMNFSDDSSNSIQDRSSIDASSSKLKPIIMSAQRDNLSLSMSIASSSSSSVYSSSSKSSSTVKNSMSPKLNISVNNSNSDNLVANDTDGSSPTSFRLPSESPSIKSTNGVNVELPSTMSNSNSHKSLEAFDKEPSSFNEWVGENSDDHPISCSSSATSVSIADMLSNAHVNYVSTEYAVNRSISSKDSDVSVGRNNLVSRDNSRELVEKSNSLDDNALSVNRTQNGFESSTASPLMSPLLNISHTLTRSASSSDSSSYSTSYTRYEFSTNVTGSPVIILPDTRLPSNGNLTSTNIPDNSSSSSSSLDINKILSGPNITFLESSVRSSHTNDSSSDSISFIGNGADVKDEYSSVNSDNLSFDSLLEKMNRLTVLTNGARSEKVTNNSQFSSSSSSFSSPVRYDQNIISSRQVGQLFSDSTDSSKVNQTSSSSSSVFSIAQKNPMSPFNKSPTLNDANIDMSATKSMLDNESENDSVSTISFERVVSGRASNTGAQQSIDLSLSNSSFDSVLSVIKASVITSSTPVQQTNLAYYSNPTMHSKEKSTTVSSASLYHDFFDDSDSDDLEMNIDSKDDVDPISSTVDIGRRMIAQDFESARNTLYHSAPNKFTSTIKSSKEMAYRLEEKYLEESSEDSEFNLMFPSTSGYALTPLPLSNNVILDNKGDDNEEVSLEELLGLRDDTSSTISSV